MKVPKFLPIFLISATFLLIFSSQCSCADINMNTGSECSRADNSTAENNFQANLKTLLDSLAEKGPLRNFYAGAAGGDGSADLVYGLVQCRGDISATNCAICIRNSTEFALSECPRSKEVAIWFTWCFLRYSTENFIDIVGLTSVAITKETNYDDPSIVSNGLHLMSGLASSAPNQPLMFETAVLDAGADGKRYGMAQCTRDISTSDCNRCLNSQIETFRTTIGSKKNWEIYGLSCFMWYHDYQFYFPYNVSSSASEFRTRRHFQAGIGKVIFLSFSVVMALIVV